MSKHLWEILSLILTASTGNYVISPHHSQSIEARPSGSSVSHTTTSDWTRSKPGPPVPDHTLNTRSRWDATGRYGNLRVQHKQRESPLTPPRGNECSARGRTDTELRDQRLNRDYVSIFNFNELFFGLSARKWMDGWMNYFFSTILINKL